MRQGAGADIGHRAGIGVDPLVGRAAVGHAVAPAKAIILVTLIERLIAEFVSAVIGAGGGGGGTAVGKPGLEAGRVLGGAHLGAGEQDAAPGQRQGGKHGYGDQQGLFHGGHASRPVPCCQNEILVSQARS